MVLLDQASEKSQAGLKVFAADGGSCWLDGSRDDSSTNDSKCYGWTFLVVAAAECASCSLMSYDTRTYLLSSLIPSFLVRRNLKLVSALHPALHRAMSKK